MIGICKAHLSCHLGNRHVGFPKKPGCIFHLAVLNIFFGRYAQDGGEDFVQAAFADAADMAYVEIRRGSRILAAM